MQPLHLLSTEEEGLFGDRHFQLQLQLELEGVSKEGTKQNTTTGV